MASSHAVSACAPSARLSGGEASPQNEAVTAVAAFELDRRATFGQRSS